MSGRFVPIIGSDYPQAIIPLIDDARRNIDIVVYDWRWYENQPGHPVQRFNMAIVRAVQRGVQVRAVLNAAELVPKLRDLGIKARNTRDSRVVHSKLLIIDSTLLVIGSHNFTRNAFGSNIETSLVVPIPPDSSRFLDFFENLYNI